MRYFLYIILFFLPLGLNAQISALTTLDSMEIWIGDQVNLSLTVSHANDVTVTQADLSGLQGLEEVEVLSESEWDTLTTQPETILEKKILLTSFDSGYYKLPPIDIFYEKDGGKGSIQTTALGLRVTPIAVVKEEGIAPIKDILEEPISVWDWLPYVLGILALILLGAWLFNYLKNRKKEVKEVPPPPVKIIPAHIIANTKIAALKEKQLWQNGEIKAYHSEVTYIVREYLENRYNIQALELTSDEIMKSLKDADIDDTQKLKLREMFQTADMVKFAKSEPIEATHIKVLEDAEQFVVDTQVISNEKLEEE